MNTTKSLCLFAFAFATVIFLHVTAFASEHDSGAFLGINPAEVTSDIASDYGVETGKGVLVEGVVSDSPAKKIGLRENDILIKLDGMTLTGPEELRVQLAKHKKGDSIQLVYLRGGKERTVTVELKGKGSDKVYGFRFGEGDDNGFSWGTPKSDKSEKMKKIAFAGIVTQELSEGLASYFKVKHGVLISEVVKDSPAEKAGLKAGDIISKIGSEDIEEKDNVFEAVRDHKPGDKVDFVIYRDGQEQTVSVELGEQESRWFGEMDTPEPPDAPDAPDAPRAHVYRWDGEDLNHLNIDLDELKNELKDLPDIDLNIPDHKVEILKEKVKALQDKSRNSRSAWKYSWNDLKEQLGIQMDELKDELAQLKCDLRRLGEELKQKLSTT